mgnify:CR=1 FL=1|jgi:hypothetical protein
MYYVEISIKWHKTSDPFYPYEAIFNNRYLKLRLNDYPEEPMYTLLVNGEVIESFDEWPSCWIR